MAQPNTKWRMRKASTRYVKTIRSPARQCGSGMFTPECNGPTYWNEYVSVNFPRPLQRHVCCSSRNINGNVNAAPEFLMSLRKLNWGVKQQMRWYEMPFHTATSCARAANFWMEHAFTTWDRERTFPQCRRQWHERGTSSKNRRST